MHGLPIHTCCRTLLQCLRYYCLPQAGLLLTNLHLLTQTVASFTNLFCCLTPLSIFFVNLNLIVIHVARIDSADKTAEVFVQTALDAQQSITRLFPWEKRVRTLVTWISERSLNKIGKYCSKGLFYLWMLFPDKGNTSTTFRGNTYAVIMFFLSSSTGFVVKVKKKR